LLITALNPATPEGSIHPLLSCSMVNPLHPKVTCDRLYAEDVGGTRPLLPATNSRQSPTRWELLLSPSPYSALLRFTVKRFFVSSTRIGATASERRRGNMKGFNDAYLQGKARIWPCPSYMCHIHSTAELSRSKSGCPDRIFLDLNIRCSWCHKLCRDLFERGR